jgi:hypothetical protein
MKRVFFKTLLAMLFLVPLSCSEDDVAMNTNLSTNTEKMTTDEYYLLMDGMKKMYLLAFQNAEARFVSYVKNYPDGLAFNISKATNETAVFLKTNYFSAPLQSDSSYGTEMLNSFKKDISYYRSSSNSRTRTLFDVNSLSYLTSTQKTIIKPYIDEIQNTSNPFEAKAVTESLERAIEIESARLRVSSSHKTEMMAISAGLWAFSHFLENGGVDKMYNALADEIYGNSARCYVSFRNVLLGSIIGFFSGAATGGWVGATAGTFTAPVIGTVTGAVSGAVAGAAVGFVSGGLSTMAAELLGSCFRASEVACRDEGGVWSKQKNMCFLY